jgi:cytochrome P450
VYAELRGMGEVVPAPWGARLLMSYEVCDRVLRDRTWITLDEPWRVRQGGTRWTAPASRELGRVLQGLNPPEHTRHRRSIGNVFGRNVLLQLTGPVQRQTERCLDDLAAHLREGEADFAALVGERLPVAAIAHWLDLPEADHALLTSLAHRQAYAQELLPTASQVQLANEATAGLREYFGAVIRDRRRSPRNDVISSWLRVWDEMEPDRAAADEAVYLLTMFIVIAALETTSTVLSGMVWTLDQHPDQLRWLRDHPDRVPDALEEILRYDPPVHVTTRAAGEDTVLGGVPIDKDQLVHVVIASANRDPSRNPDPDTLDLRREPRHLSHLAFGGGIHYCVGAALARLEASVLLAALLRRFPTLRVASPPVWEPRVAFRRLTALPVVDR